MISRARLKYLRSLRLKKVRAKEGLVLVEGLNVVEEAVRSGRARELLLSDAAAASERGRALARTGLPVHRLDERSADGLAGTRTPAGAFAVASNPCRPLRAEGLPAAQALVLLAAGVADPGNLGTLIRTAAALGAAAVVTTAGTVEPTNGKVVRATAGALFRIPVLSGEPADLREAGFGIWVADAAGKPVQDHGWRPARLALAVGSEPRGVDGSVRDCASGTVAVPLRGVESLNVAVAAGVLLHALLGLPVRER